MKQLLEKVSRSLSVTEAREKFAQDVSAGFSGPVKTVPSCYFYDARGSDLFTEITSLPEYYPTRCEKEIIQNNVAQIIDGVVQDLKGGPLKLIELGAGDTTKPYPLIKELFRREIDFTYIAVDISESALQILASNLEQDFPEIKFRGVAGHYFDALEYLKDEGSRHETSFVLFLGSNIGNFSPSGAGDFLKNIKRRLKPGDSMLCGFDLKKDVETLTSAYSDVQGVTAEFNLNLLERMNRELGANFNLENFVHHAYYNPVKSTMESYLLSSCDQEVFIKHLNRSYHFKAFEAIHTEYSHKYDDESIAELAKVGGFQVIQNFTDHENRFVDTFWRS